MVVVALEPDVIFFFSSPGYDLCVVTHVLSAETCPPMSNNCKFAKKIQVA